jgi:hypothetical protein
MPSKVITVVFKVEADTLVRVKDKVNLLQRISALPQEDQQRIIALCENKNALKGLADNWAMLQSMF